MAFCVELRQALERCPGVEQAGVEEIRAVVRPDLVEVGGPNFSTPCSREKAMKSLRKSAT